MARRTFTLETARDMFRRDSLAEWIGFVPEAVSPDQVQARMTVTAGHIAPNGFLHASVLTALADLACGAGATAALPEDKLFATLDIKTSFLGTVRQGDVLCTATARHKGVRTQVWDAEVSAADGKILALFRCTQMILDRTLKS